MKTRVIIIVLLSIISNTIFGHTINYGNLVLRKWTLVSENKSISGSFYMYKNGEVYIEDAANTIMHYPLTSFSKEDQQFAMQKDAWVKKINQERFAQKRIPVNARNPFNTNFLLVLLILVILGAYFYIFTEKKKLKYVTPILSVGIIMTLYSFTENTLQLLQTNTNPAFIDSAFAPFKPNVNTYWDATYFYVESKGIPAHQMMVGISNHGWQQQVPIPQCYIGSNAWSIPLNPIISSSPIPVDSIHFTRGAIAIAANGVPIFNVHTNTGVDSYIDGQLDNYGGHCGRGDDYHYHIAPLFLDNQTSDILPIAFALDGFAVYGSLEPDGTAMKTLDVNHGHYGSNGVYHYHGTISAPYMIANMVGQVTEDGTHQLIPQAQAHPIRPALTPLNEALITSCLPNGTNNGYNLSYTKSGQNYAVNYSWTNAGVYTFNFVSPSGTTVSTYNGFTQCLLPTSINQKSKSENNILIFPNPSKGEIEIRLSNNDIEREVQFVSIYDTKGNMVYKTSQFEQTINLGNVSGGVYIVKVQFPKYQVDKMVVIK